MGGQLRGHNRSMCEGGLRQAALARWPGTVPAGRVSDEPWAFWDFLPTAADLAGAKLPTAFKADGYSLETTDLAAARPELVAKAEALMNQAHADDPNWPMNKQ